MERNCSCCWWIFSIKYSVTKWKLRRQRKEFPSVEIRRGSPCHPNIIGGKISRLNHVISDTASFLFTYLANHNHQTFHSPQTIFRFHQIFPPQKIRPKQALDFNCQCYMWQRLRSISISRFLPLTILLFPVHLTPFSWYSVNALFITKQDIGAFRVSSVLFGPHSYNNRLCYIILQLTSGFHPLIWRVPFYPYRSDKRFLGNPLSRWGLLDLNDNQEIV